jgi:hypothetical protein
VSGRAEWGTSLDASVTVPTPFNEARTTSLTDAALLVVQLTELHGVTRSGGD